MDATTANVLVVEPDGRERQEVTESLRAAGFSVFEVENADGAIRFIDEAIDVVLTYWSRGDVSRLNLLSLWKKRKPEAQFIFIGDRSLNRAVEAIKCGAYDYLVKPVQPEELVRVIHRAVHSVQLEREIVKLGGFDRIVGRSDRMKEVLTKIQRAAVVDGSVLILGEHGSGKSLVARVLHDHSSRKKGPFVAVDSAAVPAKMIGGELFGYGGGFEQADEGTLFIEDVADLSLDLQADLLRVLETSRIARVSGHAGKRVDVRLVSASRRDIARMVSKGEFDEGLYYRLNVVTIRLPPLRERLDDIPLLVAHFLQDVSERMQMPYRRVDAEVMRRFLAYGWPGNVRELKETLEAMMLSAQGEWLTVRELPSRISEA